MNGNLPVVAIMILIAVVTNPVHDRRLGRQLVGLIGKTDDDD